MPDALWNWDALVAASGGALDGASSGVIGGFSIDTRSLQAGDVFVALKDQRDGHDFVTAAFARGAAAALVSSGYVRKAGDGALIRVDDPLRALERIAVAARARLSSEARVAAVTGSAGKTGTKEMLRACLSRFGATHAPDKSFNNHWGVPLTLARMPANTRFGVFEIGMNHPGEITPLTRMVRPHIAIITNVLPVHIGQFPNGEAGIAEAKAEIFSGLEQGGTAILLRDSPHFDALSAVARKAGAKIVSFGNRGSGADVELHSTGHDEDPKSAQTVVAQLPNKEKVAFSLGIAGDHIATNALAVAAALHELGLPVARGMAALTGLSAAEGRGSRAVFPLGSGGFVLLIDESYNANPASMAAAVRTAAKAGHPSSDWKRLVLVLGDMLELGENSADYHRGLQPAVAEAKAELVFACGPAMKHLFDSLPMARRGAWAPDSSGLVDVVPPQLRAGDVVMVKGSFGSRMAPVVAAIRARFAATGNQV